MLVSETETVANVDDGFNALFGFHIICASAELSVIYIVIVNSSTTL